jgi:hypothetical protein
MVPLLTIAEAQQLAQEVASRYGVFECERCAVEIARRLRNGFPATFERLRTSDQSDVIGLVEEGVQISRTGTHTGVRIGDKVYDNLYHEGVLETEWAGRFVAATEVPLLKVSRPVSDFFGKVFLTKKFIKWLFGT